MYYTTDEDNSIRRAGLDGSNPVTIISGEAGDYWDIATDFNSSTLFWTARSAHTIESSDLNGGNRRTIVRLPANSYPRGIALANDRIYWAHSGDEKKLQSGTIHGNDVITLLTDTKTIHALTLVPDLSLPQDRTNHCARNSCLKVCVLTAITATSYFIPLPGLSND